MELGISTITRMPARTDPELDARKLNPVDRSGNAKAVSAEVAKEKAAKAEAEKDGEGQQASVTEAELADMAGKINELFQNESRSLQFSVDEDSGRTVIKIIDTATGEQIKQIPAEELLEISRKLSAQVESDEVKAGVLVKSKA